MNNATRNPIIALLAALALLLAGCTGPTTLESTTTSEAGSEETQASDPNSSTEPGTSEAPDPDVEYGEITGIVTDDSQLPVANASIVLDNDAQETVSNLDGTFALSYVDPGTHDLTVVKEGFTNQSLRINVEPGKTAQAAITLVAEATVSDYVETFVQTGFVLCGVAVRPPTLYNVGTSVCNPLGADKFKLNYKVPTWENVTGVWLETSWTSTQVFGNGLQANWWIMVPGGQLNGYLAIDNGTSPLTIPVPRQALEDFYVYVNQKGLDQCSGDVGCGLEGWHFAYSSALGSSSPADFAVLINQTYNEYVTIFHRVPFPETFTALPPP